MSYAPAHECQEPVLVITSFCRNPHPLRQKCIKIFWVNYVRNRFAAGGGVPLGPKLLHYITLLFRIIFPDYVIIFYITELVSNYFLGYVISGVVSKYTPWTLDYIT